MATTVTVLLAACVLGLLAIAVAWILGWANQAFHVEVDARVTAVNDALPGANCGGCGYVGCNEYAEAIVAGTTELNLCAPGGASCTEQLAEVMGISVEHALPYRAVIHCAAVREQRLGQTAYEGEMTCTAANLVTDVQGCVYGCLGLGDCATVCPYDAIHVEDGLAKVDFM